MGWVKNISSSARKLTQKSDQGYVVAKHLEIRTLYEKWQAKQVYFCGEQYNVASCLLCSCSRNLKLDFMTEKDWGEEKEQPQG